MRLVCIHTATLPSFILRIVLLWFIFHHSRNLFEKTLFCMPSVNPQYDKRLFIEFPAKIQVQNMFCTKIVFSHLFQTFFVAPHIHSVTTNSTTGMSLIYNQTLNAVMQKSWDIMLTGNSNNR